MNKTLTGLFFVFLLTASLPAAVGLQDDWPRTLPVGDGLMTIYPLQIDGLEGDVLRYRAALAWRPTADSEPVFGAGWFESRVVIDQTSRVVFARDLEVTQVRFPEGTAYLYSEFAAVLAEQAPGWNLDVSLDDVKGGLRTAEAEQAAVRDLNTAPPRIVYRDRPAVLVTLDGEPLLRNIEETPYEAVINTPYPLISDGRHFYLNAAKDVWYRADEATGPYRFEPSPPAEIAAMVKPDANAEAVEASAEPITAANAPEIVVATEPTELIVTDGPAVFVPLVDELLVLQNSDDDVFMHVASQKYYIVLAGRWYHADSLTGPWAYQAADRLPEEFAEIPTDSAQADSRVFVAGTPEAKEAVLDAQIPETRTVARGPADVEVEYDGEPSFAPVDGTDMAYAANTDAAVLESDRQYYLVEDGVWYESATPNGPWEVATRRPDGVESIAPTSPVYNTKYVYIYGSTPNVVYVGYTPGYLGSYVYYDTVVYGTGWYYRPWVSPVYYYPRPRTWGFHVTYDSWYGWSLGFSWNWGWGWGPYYGGFYSGGYWHHGHHWHHRHRGYWRPRGHHRPRPGHYAHHGYHRDRHDYGGDRGNRGGRSGNYRINEAGEYPADLRTARNDRPRDAAFADRSKTRRHRTDPVDASHIRRKARTRDASFAAARDAAVAGRPKAQRHRTEPVDASHLRLKAQARDANAVGARNVLVADSRRDLRPAAAGFRGTPAGLRQVDATERPVRNAAVPARADRQQGRNLEPRRPGNAGGPSRRPEADAAAATRRAPAASPSRAAPPADRRAAPDQRRPPQRPVAASPASRPTVARRDQPRRAQAAPAAAPRAPAQRAGPGPGGPSRSAAPPPQQRGGPHNAGGRPSGRHDGPGRARRDRSRME